jgi:hypothetical protein
VLLAQVRIERTDVPSGVGVQFNAGIIGMKSRGCVLCGLAARIAAHANASGLSLALRHSFHGSQASPSPVLKTP